MFRSKLSDALLLLGRVANALDCKSKRGLLLVRATSEQSLHLLTAGYALLAGRVRRPQEEQLVSEVLAKHFKCKVDPERLFSRVPCEVPPPGFSHLVWTADARRLAALLERAWRFEEPVLLVGDTG